MADKSHIEWTNATWNPVLGCDKISTGCKNCYAIRTAWRLQHNPNPKVAKAFEGLTVLQGGQPNWTGRINFVPERLSEPMGWKQPRRIFVNSQSDLFHEALPQDVIDRIFAVMCLCPQHTFQILTKRPERMRDYMLSEQTFPRISVWLKDWCFAADAKLHITMEERKDGMTGISPPNVWLGVSVESPKYKSRIDLLRETPAAVRMLSLEPLLEDLGEINLQGIHWVIVGGESGPNARPMHPEWARSLRDQCQAAGVPFFFKQWGEWVSPDQFSCDGWDDVVMNSSGVSVYPDGRVTDQWGIASDDSERVWKVGKKAAGRLLDGKEHSEYPEASENGGTE